jgi:hypothetical protein
VLYLQVGRQVRGPTCLFPHRSSGGDLIRGNKVLDVVTVPAVVGRLLRFEGSMLHAVPRPTDLWLLPFVQGVAMNEPEEEWGRSVILFNTWLGSPPKDVRTWDKMPDESSIQCHLNEDWRLDWEYHDKKHKVVTEPPVPLSVVKIWLLGTAARRNHLWRTVSLTADEERLKDALNESTKVSVVPLFQP